jgi:uncharacterized SAM-binding protein YcdF (DUF218 family)
MKKIIFGLGALFIGVSIASLVYVGIHAYDNTAKPSDAILILGAKSQYKNMTNPCLKARVEKGVMLYKQKYAPKIIMSGGDDSFQKDNQAEKMKAIATALGVPSSAILLEKQSSNTYENFLYTKRILQDKKLSSIILVSDPYHLARAELLAKTMHIPFSVSPATQSPCWSTYTFLGFDYFRDSLALIQYILTGKISFSSLTSQ